MLNFENTKIAFQSKSDADLRNALFLFRMMSRNTLQRLGVLAAKTALAIHFPISWAIKPTIYSHFVGGESIDECSSTAKLLNKYGVQAILDYSVEGKEADEDIQHALEETLRSIKNAGNNKDIPFAVFKPTAFTKSIVLEKASSKADLSDAEKKEAQKFKNRIGILCKAAFDANTPILIDAEDSWYQNFIDETVEENMKLYNKEKAIVYNTWQMYRHDRLANLKQAHKKAKESGYILGAKFVRGAYMEKERERALEKGYPSPINPDKPTTDREYNAALKFCIENINEISIFNGTHNEDSSKYLASLMEEKGLMKNDPRIIFSQLYGMSDHISFNLAAEGYNVAKYLPYGPVRYVLPYLFRRAEENTSVKGQTGRELKLLVTEQERRKRESKS